MISSYPPHSISALEIHVCNHSQSSTLQLPLHRSTAANRTLENLRSRVVTPGDEKQIYGQFYVCGVQIQAISPWIIGLKAIDSEAMSAHASALIFMVFSPRETPLGNSLSTTTSGAGFTPLLQSSTYQSSSWDHLVPLDGFSSTYGGLQCRFTQHGQNINERVNVEYPAIVRPPVNPSSCHIREKVKPKILLNDDSDDGRRYQPRRARGDSETRVRGLVVMVEGCGGVWERSWTVAETVDTTNETVDYSHEVGFAHQLRQLSAETSEFETRQCASAYLRVFPTTENINGDSRVPDEAYPHDEAARQAPIENGSFESQSAKAKEIRGQLTSYTITHHVHWRVSCDGMPPWSLSHVVPGELEADIEETPLFRYAVPAARQARNILLPGGSLDPMQPEHEIYEMLHSEGMDGGNDEKKKCAFFRVTRRMYMTRVVPSVDEAKRLYW
ncbi:hypothetical protein BDN67DRAFT_983815 [Paxillus ammoniavirescens]|nr:hypothetical protein BDN67DRAFT_983815 [Paxillus ammoniavirescens]